MQQRGIGKAGHMGTGGIQGLNGIAAAHIHIEEKEAGVNIARQLANPNGLTANLRTRHGSVRNLVRTNGTIGQFRCTDSSVRNL